MMLRRVKNLTMEFTSFRNYCHMTQCVCARARSIYICWCLNGTFKYQTEYTAFDQGICRCVIAIWTRCEGVGWAHSIFRFTVRVVRWSLSNFQFKVKTTMFVSSPRERRLRCSSAHFSVIMYTSNVNKCRNFIKRWIFNTNHKLCVIIFKQIGFWQSNEHPIQSMRDLKMDAITEIEIRTTTKTTKNR